MLCKHPSHEFRLVRVGVQHRIMEFIVEPAAQSEDVVIGKTRRLLILVDLLVGVVVPIHEGSPIQQIKPIAEEVIHQKLQYAQGVHHQLSNTHKDQG